MSANAKEALGKVVDLNSTDEDSIEYLVTTLEELGERATVNEVSEALAELFVGLGLLEDEDQAAKACSELHGFMNPASENDENSFPVDERNQGDEVLALKTPVNLGTKKQQIDKDTRRMREAAGGLDDALDKQKKRGVDRSEQAKGTRGYQKHQRMLEKQKNERKTFDPDSAEKRRVAAMDIFLDANTNNPGVTDIVTG
ncbi:hypothetical protein SARC_10673, partial [Sphaeroforma arctica JP610]